MVAVGEAKGVAEVVVLEGDVRKSELLERKRGKTGFRKRNTMQSMILKFKPTMPLEMGIDCPTKKRTEKGRSRGRMVIREMTGSLIFSLGSDAVDPNPVLDEVNPFSLCGIQAAAHLCDILYIRLD